MRALEEYIHNHNHGKIARFLHRVSKVEMNAPHTNTHSHRACLAIRDLCFTKSLKKDVVLLQSCLHLCDIMPKHGSHKKISKDIIADIGCGRYTQEDGTQIYRKEYLHLNIVEYIKQHKIIFIMFGFMDYFVDTFLDGNGHLAHSVCAILIPYKDHYGCYYINSHGQDMKEAVYYDWIVSRKRIKRVHYDQPVDILFMESLISFWNSQLEDSSLPIRYDGSSRHTYFGPNLQAGDIHGVCFMFPQIIWYYFGQYYHKCHDIRCNNEDYIIPTGKKLIREGNLNLFVIGCFMDFCPHYKQYVCNQWQLLHYQYTPDFTVLQDIIEQRQTKFIKTILRALVQFSSQRYLL